MITLSLVKHTRDSSGDDNNVSTRESLGEAIISGKVSCYFLYAFSFYSYVYSDIGVGTYCRAGDVREVGGDTICVDNIIERELGDVLVGLEEER